MEKVNKFTVRKYEAEAIEEVYRFVEDKLNGLMKPYRRTGEQKQKKNWSTDELVFDEEGNPVMEDVWDYVEIPEEELDDEGRAKAAAYRNVLKQIENL